MATHRSPSSLLAAMKARHNRVQRSLQIAAEQNAQTMKAEALRLVGGHVSSDTLAGLGHPFGRSYAGYAPHTSSSAFLRKYPVRVAIAALPINQQSGELARSLRVFRRQRQGETVYQLQFTSPHVVVLLPGGTLHMIDRGFWKALNARYYEITHARNVEAIQSANLAA